MAAIERITLGGGCFWCLDAVFRRVRGVLRVESGYANGSPAWAPPSYEQVCSGQTGFVEVVQLDFDPQQVTLRELLEVFFAVHDPTTLNRQGNDIGTQYRSGIYWHQPAQAELAQAVMAEWAPHFSAPLVTEVQPVAHYSAAEAYHQDYFTQHPQQGYCAYVVAPKVDKLQRHFTRLLRTD